MTTAQALPTRVAIIGGGISGLGAAYYLQQRAVRGGRALDIHIFERKSDRVTLLKEVEAFLMEHLGKGAQPDSEQAS